jgi:hypothetical protein
MAITGASQTLSIYTYNFALRQIGYILYQTDKNLFKGFRRNDAKKTIEGVMGWYHVG